MHEVGNDVKAEKMRLDKARKAGCKGSYLNHNVLPTISSDGKAATSQNEVLALGKDTLRSRLLFYGGLYQFFPG